MHKMKSIKIILFVMLCGVILSLSSCLKAKEPISTTKARENDDAIQAYLKSKNITNTIKTGSGVYYVITTPNTTGKVPAVGDLITYSYLSSRLDGFKLDSATTQKPNYSPFGTVGNLWTNMASILKEGEKATFYLPYSFGYGDTDVPNVPAYSPIIMEFSILNLKNEDEQIESYLKDKKINAIKTSTGLRYSITSSVAAGDSLKNGQTVVIKYTGSLLYYSSIRDANNKITNVFDSGSFSMVLGQGRSIAGFEEGVKKLKVGEKGIIIMPSAIGYGDTGSKNATTGAYTILPKAPLAFDIEIVSAK